MPGEKRDREENSEKLERRSESTERRWDDEVCEKEKTAEKGGREGGRARRGEES